jgi:hypothetical protein
VTQVAQKSDWTSASSNVVPFTRKRSDSTSGAGSIDPNVYFKVLADKGQHAQMKRAIDMAVFDALLNDSLIDFSDKNNPFGSIYISKLRPDAVKPETLVQILNCSAIEDLSDTIHFDDEFED